MNRLRPVDLARDHGLSTQAVRNYEDAGILPPAERTPSGYRVYTPAHAQALRAFISLIPAHGHQTATAIMQAVNQSSLEEALALIDASHEQLRQDRQTLAAVEKALRDLAPPGGAAVTGAASSGAASSGSAFDGSAFSGAVARQLGLRPATLRKWERAGLLQPRRDPKTGYRVYSPADIRDAHLAHQLRRGGYLLREIALVLGQVRAAGGAEALEAALADWRSRLTTRGLAMLSAAGELHVFLASHAHYALVSTSAASRLSD